jgi:hypothetical protein
MLCPLYTAPLAESLLPRRAVVGVLAPREMENVASPLHAEPAQS